MKIIFFVWDHLLEYNLLLAKSLQAAGADVTFIVQTAEGAQHCFDHGVDFLITGNLYESFAVQETIEQWWTAADTAEPERLRYRGYNLRDLCEYELLRAGIAPPPGLVAGFLRSAAETVEFISRLIDCRSPRALVLWNGLCLPTRAIAAVARERGIAVFYEERGYFPGTLVLDPVGVNFGAAPSRSWSAIQQTLACDAAAEEQTMRHIERFHLQARSVAGSAEKMSPGELRARFTSDPREKIILYVAQIDSDTNILFYSPHFKDNAGLITTLNTIVSGCAGARLLVKLHPEDVNRSAEFQQLLAGNAALVGDVNIHALLQMADIIIVRNSTVGLEALTYCKPVIALGQAIYSHKGLTRDVPDEQALASVLRSLLENPQAALPDRKAINRFLYYLLRHYLYFIDGNELFAGSNKSIEQQLLAAGEAPGDRQPAGRTPSREEKMRSIRKAYAAQYLQQAWEYYHRGDMKQFRRCVGKACTVSFPNLPVRIIVPYVKSFLGKDLSGKIHAAKKRFLPHIFTIQ
jgi:hypothetical protein